MPGYIGQRLMEVNDRSLEIGEVRCAVAAPNEQRPRVPQNVIHVPDQFVRRSDLVPRSKRSEIRRSPAQRLLRPVCESSQKMFEKISLGVH
jgi:hypothetical protein